MDKLIMSRKEREQLGVFKKLVAGEMTQATAAQVLQISERWVRKKLKRYHLQGDAGLVHQGRGRPSQRRWDGQECALAIELLKSEWRGFGPTFTAEKLKELKDIVVSEETVRKVMIKEGLWISGKRKQKHRQWRERKRMVGILIQLDGSPHDWFEGRGPKCTLLVFIDDATSQLLWLEFVESESFAGVAFAAQKYLEKYGRPVSFYVDYGSVFSVNRNNPDRDKKTQFERILAELDIGISHARSPEAKGRVERANQTLQDRLVKEMRLAGISSMEAANMFVQGGDFMAKHNEKFAVPPAAEGDAHRSTDGYNLYNAFCTQEERVITNDFTVHYKRKKIQLEKEQPTIIRPKNRIVVCEHLDGKISIYIRKSRLNFKEVGIRKIGKISPVDYVLRENDEFQEKAPLSGPLYGNLVGALNNQNLGVENRNFSCC